MENFNRNLKSYHSVEEFLTQEHSSGNMDDGTEEIVTSIKLDPDSEQKIDFSWTDADASMANMSRNDCTQNTISFTRVSKSTPQKVKQMIVVTQSCANVKRTTLTPILADTCKPPEKTGKLVRNCNVALTLLQSNSGKRPQKIFECGVCGHEFKEQYTLMRHLPTHTDERKYSCQTCGKAFRQLSTLTQHRAIHSKEKPYSCEICFKKFNRTSTLNSHKKIHQQNKSFQCPVCKKSFHQKGNLQNHIFTHTNSRPYRCNVCNRGFNQQSNLVYHKSKRYQ